MMALHENGAIVATFEGNPSLARFLVKNPDTHDYEWDGSVFRLRFRKPYELIRFPERGMT